MTTPAHYRLKSETLQVTPSGQSAVDITGVQSVPFAYGGQTIDLASDSSEVIQEIVLNAIKGNLSIEGIAQLFFNEATLPLGACSVTFTMERVATGRGAVSGADKIVTITNCVLVSKDTGVASGAGSNISLNFEVAADTNGKFFVFSDPS